MIITPATKVLLITHKTDMIDQGPLTGIGKLCNLVTKTPGNLTNGVNETPENTRAQISSWITNENPDLCIIETNFPVSGGGNTCLDNAFFNEFPNKAFCIFDQQTNDTFKNLVIQNKNVLARFNGLVGLQDGLKSQGFNEEFDQFVSGSLGDNQALATDSDVPETMPGQYPSINDREGFGLKADLGIPDDDGTDESTDGPVAGGVPGKSGSPGGKLKASNTGAIQDPDNPNSANNSKASLANALGGAIDLGSSHASNVSGDPSVDDSANIGSQLIGDDDSGNNGEVGDDADEGGK